MIKRIISIALITVMWATVFVVFPAQADASTMTKVGTLYYKSSKYQLIANERGYDFAKAKKYCEKLGGHLATITSDDENEALYDFIHSLGYENAYFVYTDEAHEGKWKWVTGESSRYSNWAYGEPNNESGREHYGMFYYKSPQYTWNDGGFNTINSGIDETAFICEWDIEVVSKNTTSVKLKWVKTPKVKKYVVQRYVLGEWKQVAATSSNSRIVKNLPGGTLCKFRIVSYNSAGKRLSATRAITVTTIPKTPVAKKIKAGTKRITLSWNRTQCKGYQVQYSTNRDFITSKKKTVTNSAAKSTTISKLKKGKKYYVKVRAYVTTNGVKEYGGWSKVKSIRCR